jgi:hypothetical protein
MIRRLAPPQCGVIETVAVVLMVLRLTGVGSAPVVLVRLPSQLERLGEQVDRVARPTGSGSASRPTRWRGDSANRPTE